MFSFRVDQEIHDRFARIREQYSPHARLTDWMNAWLLQMIELIEQRGADPRTLLPLGYDPVPIVRKAPDDAHAAKKAPPVSPKEAANGG